jgi:putative transposase
MTTRQTEGALAAAARLEAREVRSYESEYSGGLWLMRTSALCGVQAWR